MATTADITPKPEETVLDRLKSRKFWMTSVGAIVPMLLAANNKVDLLYALLTSAGVLIAGILGLSKEDAAKHARDGQIAMADATLAHASAILEAKSAAALPGPH